MKKIITRFAPSPTGNLHVGNIRTAIINYLFARAQGGEFILRIDDTDKERSKDEYKDNIINDLKWLNLNWDKTFNQLSRLERYNEVKQQLLNSGRLYPCYESKEELDMKRKLLISNKKPPIYDRAALRITEAKKLEYQSLGKKPHYRFKLDDELIHWQDVIKGEVKYEPANLSDPIVIKEDGSMTYMLCSVIDDFDYNITHIIRGEDHVSNTAVQWQMFKALNAQLPIFCHLNLVKSKEDKISKRVGGFEVANLREDLCLEPMTINSFFSSIGSSRPILPFKDMANLIKHFDLKSFSKSAMTYQVEELIDLNHKFILELGYHDIKDKLPSHITEAFWQAVKANLNNLKDLDLWWQVCFKPNLKLNIEKDYLQQALKLLPEGQLNNNSWRTWTQDIAAASSRKGKALFLPLRRALTGLEEGPDLALILPLIGREEIIRRLSM